MTFIFQCLDENVLKKCFDIQINFSLSIFVKCCKGRSLKGSEIFPYKLLKGMDRRFLTTLCLFSKMLFTTDDILIIFA